VSVTILGLTIGSTTDGFVIPSLVEVRAALSDQARKLRGIANLHTEPGSLYGYVIDAVSTGVDIAMQSAASLVYGTIFNFAQGVRLDWLLAGFLERVQASPSTVVAYAYGTGGAAVGAGTALRTSPTGVAFTTDGATVIPVAPNSEAYVVELTPFEAGVYVGMFFFVNVDGTAVPYPVNALDTGQTVRDGFVAMINALGQTQRAYSGGTSPTTGRLALVVVETQGAGVFPLTVSGPVGNIFSFAAIASPATAGVSGPTQAPAGSLRYGPPLAGVQGYTNPVTAVLGRQRETDSQFRARWQVVQRGLGGGSPDAVRGIILSPVELNGGGATFCTVEYNPTDVVDAAGNLPHSLRVVVNQDADGQTVANALWRAKAAGDNTNGPEAYVVTDASGNPQDVLIDRLQDVWTACNVEVTVGEGWPVTGDPLSQLRTDIAAYVEALAAGADVRVNTLPISNNPDGTPRGVANFNVQVGTGPGPGGPFLFNDVYPAMEPDAALASIVISGREKARMVVGDVAASIVP
jgi:hypothetical protein